MELPSGVETRRIRRDEFRRMIDAGIFSADERLELVHGRLVVVPPQGPPHTYVSTTLRDRLLAAYGGSAVVREDKPLDCGDDELPEPDLTVASGTARDYAERDPRADEAILVVEISRTTQRLDREKAAIYASAGAAVYWIVDVAARRVEVHAHPKADGRYGVVRVLGEEEELEVPQLSARWRVGDLLP